MSGEHRGDGAQPQISLKTGRQSCVGRLRVSTSLSNLYVVTACNPGAVSLWYNVQMYGTDQGDQELTSCDDCNPGAVSLWYSVQMYGTDQGDQELTSCDDCNPGVVSTFRCTALTREIKS